MFFHTPVSNIECKLVNNADELKSILKTTLVNRSISCFLYTLQKRQSFFVIDRDELGRVKAIFHENLIRGLPAARDILQAIINTGFSQNVQFIDVSQIERFVRFKQNGGEFDFENKRYGGEISDLLSQSYEGFYKIKAKLKTYEFYTIPTIKMLEEKLKMDEKSKSFIFKTGLFADKADKVVVGDVVNKHEGLHKIKM